MIPRYSACLLLLIALLSACRPDLYTAPDLRGDEASARVVTDSPKDTVWKSVPRLYVSKVDDRSTFRLCWDAPFCWPKEAVMPAGRHHIGLHYDAVGSFADATLWLDAEAGVTYIARNERVVDGVRFWLEDTRTGKPVGGIAGSEPEQ
jgi:hypothetical protein